MEQQTSQQTGQQSYPGGEGPAFTVAEMPESPLKGMTAKKLFLTMGPAVIALGGAIGGGEWLVGPALFVKYGLALLWIVTVSTTLQTFLNLEMTRYTLATGEPITLGMMRLKPGKEFWGILFSAAMFFERALPGWAIAAATGVAAMQLARIPGAGDQGVVVFWGYVVFLACGAIISIGGKIERTLEWANWVMVGIILVSLLLLDLYMAPAETWGRAVLGYFQFGAMPAGVDILLLGALVGYSAYGGCGNNALTNWYRDKGYGMAKHIGYISTAVGGHEMHVSASGSIAPPTKQNLENFSGWWKMLNIDQWAVFWVGGILGMFLPAILYVSSLPPGTTLPAWGIAVSTSSGLVQHFGILGLYMVAFIGFWVLFSTAISNVDLVPRQATDMLWYSSPAVRKWAKGDIRKVYYGLLLGVMIWGGIYMNITLPLVIFAISANVAHFTMALSSAVTVTINRKFLPPEYRPPVWREVVMYINTIFFGFFFLLFIATYFFGIKVN